MEGNLGKAGGWMVWGLWGGGEGKGGGCGEYSTGNTQGESRDHVGNVFFQGIGRLGSRSEKRSMSIACGFPRNSMRIFTRSVADGTATTVPCMPWSGP